MKDTLTPIQYTVAFVGIVILVFLYKLDVGVAPITVTEDSVTVTGNKITLTEKVLPEEGVVLPIEWGDIGKQMVELGVIDAEKFESLYINKGGLSEYELGLLYGEDNKSITMDSQNAGVVLNMLWAFGLANENPILEEGPMMDEKYGGADRFASTGGWTISRGNVMDHYGAYKLATLSLEQQKLVENVSKNIYRPCCNNSTYFPDCNHGMAMLGLLELLASNGASEQEMYDIALQVNSYWFQSSYLTIAKYFEGTGVDWNEVDSKEILSSAYSSSSGYRELLTKIAPEQQSGVSCGV